MPIAHYAYPALDCRDPLKLAEFYSKLSGFKVHAVADEDGRFTWVELREGKSIRIAFQKVTNYVRPTWPVGPVPQQIHLDFFVTNLDTAERKLLALGAKKSKIQTSINPEEHFRVYFDPAGHPFCLVHVNSLPTS
jgi:hypothetical protein